MKYKITSNKSTNNIRARKQKLNKRMNICFALSIICIIISIIIVVVYSFLSGKIYLDVNDKNRAIIEDIFAENDYSTDLTSKKITRIGRKQGLGDWYLYIEYDTGEKIETILNDDELRELYDYIGSNGQVRRTFRICNNNNVIYFYYFYYIYTNIYNL